MKGAFYTVTQKDKRGNGVCLLGPCTASHQDLIREKKMTALMAKENEGSNAGSANKPDLTIPVG